jgi:single-stranded-DNA-specific exonuclease
MGENKHVRFTVEAGGVRARAVAFGTAGKLPCEADVPVDATFTLELNEWNGSVEPRLILKTARPSEPGPITVIECKNGDMPRSCTWLAAVFAECEADPKGPVLPRGSSAGPEAPVAAGAARDRRGGGLAGTIHGLVASGEPVLVSCAHSAHRLRHLEGRLGGFALTSHGALERDPDLARQFAHVVLMDPGRPPVPPGPVVHLAWGAPEVDWTVTITQQEHDLRAALTAIYRALRDRGTAAGEELEAALREGDPLRSPAQAGRALRVLAELDLVSLDPDRRAVEVPAPERTELENSVAFRAYRARGEDELRFLRTAKTAGTGPTAVAAAAA